MITSLELQRVHMMCQKNWRPPECIITPTMLTAEASIGTTQFAS